MPGGNGTSIKKIDETVKDEILRYPTVDFILKLFPDARMRGRSSMCNPLRGEKHPSLSFVRDMHGISRWKDFAEDTTGDNIDFFRKVHPEMDYVTAVDSLAWFLLGRSAFVDSTLERSPYVQSPVKSRAVAKRVEPEQVPTLKIVSSSPLLDSDAFLLDYCSSRGISPALASLYLEAVVFRNDNKVGRFLQDESGRIVYGPDGAPLVDRGESLVLGMRNDIGGWSLRGVDSVESIGFKGCDRSAISTVLADGTRPLQRVRYVGDVAPVVEDIHYDPAREFLTVNARRDGFCGVRPEHVLEAERFFMGMRGRTLMGRELECTVGVLDSLSSSHSPVACVVEGMFDALSFIRLYHPVNNDYIPGVDMVVLNSTSNYAWAVPFLAAHGEVHSFLDNDARSKKGAQTFGKLSAELSSFSGSIGKSVPVYDDSGTISPAKDLNEYLKNVLMSDASLEKKKPFLNHKK